MLERSTTWICQEGKKNRWVNLYQNPSQQLEQTAQINYFLKCFDICVRCDCEGYTLFKGVIPCADISVQTSQVHWESLKGLVTAPKGFLEVQSSQGAAWLMLHPLKELPQSSTALHFSEVEQQEGTWQIPPASCGPGSNHSQAQPPCWWLWPAGCCRILSFPPFHFCSFSFCSFFHFAGGLHPLRGIPWHFTGFRDTHPPAESS